MPNPLKLSKAMSDKISMETTKNLHLSEAAQVMGISEREVVHLAKRGEVVRFKKNEEYLYRVKVKSQTPTRTPPSASPDQENGFIVLRDAHQSAKALVRQLQHDNRLLQNMNRKVDKSLFRWKMLVGACTLTILLLGSAVFLSYHLYQGRGMEILEAQNSLAATQQKFNSELTVEKFKNEQLVGQLDSQKKLTQKSENQLSSQNKKLEAANQRINELTIEVVELLKEKEAIPPGPIWSF